MRSLGYIALSLTLLAACDRPPSADGAAEWTPRDHDRGEESSKNTAPASNNAGDKAVDPVRKLVELTWQGQCSACHGAIGRGDGPNGPMVKATDLTNEAWQGKVTDAQIAESIRNGKGKMPKFELSDPVVQGLVARVRATRGR